MYNAFFGFRENPFNLSPDPAFLYPSPQHEEALANLLYGVQSRKGFIVLTGEVGTGKTTMLDTKIVGLSRLPASYFVSVSYMCWAYRRRKMTVKGEEVEYD